MDKKNLYKYSHKILGELYKSSPQGQEVTLGTIDLNNRTNIKIDIIERVGSILFQNQEISISSSENQQFFTLNNAGKAAFNEKKYIKLANKEFREKTLFVVNVIVPIIALLVSIFSIWLNHSLEQRVYNLEHSNKIYSK